ncbi:MAG: hypothetical protein AAGF12_31465 [Myxococcota bacterium]
MNVRKTPWIMMLALGCVAWSSTAFAQDWGTDPEGGDWEAPPPQQTAPPPQQTAPPPQQTPPPQAPPPQQNNWTGQQQPQNTIDNEPPPGFSEANESSGDDGGSDHQRVVGRVGIGWFGIQQVAYPAASLAAPTTMAFDPSGEAPAGTAPVSGNVGFLSLPTIGARIWLSEMIGIDAALGFHFSSGSDEVDSIPGDVVGTDTPTTTAFLLHAGLPLAFFHQGHYKFLLIPEIELGFATGDDGGSTNLSGFTFTVGARAGTEIHFGFIGLPFLALQASVGLKLQFVSTSVDACPTGNCSDQNIITSGNNFSLQTLDFNEPWDIFTGNVAAIYYF